MKNIQKIIIVAATLAVLSIGWYCFIKKPIVKDSSTFIVGTASGYAPFVSINQNGDYEGFDIDVATALSAKMGTTLEIKDLGSMASLFMALEQGSIDAIIWGLSVTQDRLKKVAMVRYQGEDVTAYSLIFWQNIPAGITDISAMTDMTICVEPASSQDGVLSRYPLVHKMFTEKVDDALLNIQYGKADAALVEPTIAKKFKNKYPEIQILEIPLAPEDQVHGVGIAIKQDNHSLREKVTLAIRQLDDEGLIKEYEKKWDI
jgi:ABC-type amino acid transport substrate-binding protein